MTVRYTGLMHTEREQTTYGTRDELIAELERLQEGFTHLGKDKLAREAGDAVYDLKTNCTATQVGHTLYKVTDDTLGRTITGPSRSTDRA